MKRANSARRSDNRGRPSIRAVLRQVAEKLLADVPAQSMFHCHDGQVLKNMRDLGTALNSMTTETFLYHVDGSKNDFSNWVRDMVKDEKLADDLAACPTQSSAAKRVLVRAAFLETKVLRK